MLRALVVVLLVFNLLFFGWARGWFGAAWPPPGESQREPERVAAQVRPERLLLLSPEAARAALPPPRASAPLAAPPGALPGALSGALSGASAPATGALAAPAAPLAAAGDTLCLEAGPFTADQLTAANRTLSRAGVDLSTLTDVPVAATGWLVFAGRFADAAARRTRLQAWQRQGVPVPDLLEAPRELAPGLVFSRHASKADADTALAALTARYPAVANVARVVQGPEGTVRLSRLRAPAAVPALAQKLRDAALPQGLRFTRCAAV